MINQLIHFRMVLILAVLVFGCSGAGDENTVSADDNVIEILETTNVTVNDHQVAVANIGERELPGEDGSIAMRMSAILSIMDNSTQEEWTLTVTEGDSVALGNRIYCVGSIKAEEGSRGLLTLIGF